MTVDFPEDLRLRRLQVRFKGKAFFAQKHEMLTSFGKLRQRQIHGHVRCTIDVVKACEGCYGTGTVLVDPHGHIQQCAVCKGTSLGPPETKSVAWSYCSTSDEWDLIKGQKIAFGRALEGLTLNREQRTQAWRSFWEWKEWERKKRVERERKFWEKLNKGLPAQPLAVEPAHAGGVRQDAHH